MWTRASLFCRFTDTTYTKPVPLKYEKVTTKYPCLGIFYNVFIFMPNVQEINFQQVPESKKKLTKD